MIEYKYFKHKTNNLLATQSAFTEELIKKTDYDCDIQYFEVQVEISGIMHSKLKRYSADEWEEITNQEFINLITENER